MVKFNRTYTNEEKFKREVIFNNNLKIIDKMNFMHKGVATFGVNKFADLSPKEFRSKYLMPKGIFGGPRAQNKPPTEPVHAMAPSSFDWRTRNAVTPTKDQGQCGSCWAFSATEAIESAWFLAGHPLTSLSPQQIVDCDQGNGDEGCNGGDTTTAYAYVIKAKGQEPESDYPYTGEDGTCAFNSKDILAKIRSWKYITTTMNETEMLEKLYITGPLSICVDATTWQFYFGGIIEHLCSSAPDDLDHCVMITGYGQRLDWLDRNTPVWNIRNSWGSDWGYDGYLYVERGYNLCGVADEVTVPVI